MVWICDEMRGNECSKLLGKYIFKEKNEEEDQRGNGLIQL
jgi:hypothetical protein